eukprot:16072018-Heterocapsa_arctica.AAC.1
MVAGSSTFSKRATSCSASQGSTRSPGSRPQVGNSRVQALPRCRSLNSSCLQAVDNRLTTACDQRPLATNDRLRSTTAQTSRRGK